MKIYRGLRHPACNIVTGDDQPLNPRTDLRNHSPDGFEWGFGGSGPAQLALAILADHLADDCEAEHLYQAFKFYVVSPIKKGRWMITSDEIDKFVKDLRAGRIP